MLLSEAEGNTEGDVIGESSTDPAQSESLYTHGNSLGGKREIPQVSATNVIGFAVQAIKGQLVATCPGIVPRPTVRANYKRDFTDWFVLLGRRRTSEPTVTTDCWILSGCHRKTFTA